MGDRKGMFQQCTYQGLAKQAGENKEIWLAKIMDVGKLQYEKKNVMKNSNISKISTENINIHEHPRTLHYLKGQKKQKKKEYIYNAITAINQSRKKVES